jgi:hypothetical protein
MKKLNLLGVALLSATLLTACGNNNSGNSSSNNSSSSQTASNISIKKGTVKTPEGTIKITGLETYEAQDPAVTGTIRNVVVKYTFKNESKKAVKPDDVFNDYLSISEMTSKQEKDLQTSAGIAVNKTPYDALMSDANDKLLPGKSIDAAIPAGISKGHSQKFKIAAHDKEHNKDYGSSTFTAKVKKSDDFSTKKDDTSTAHTINQTGNYAGYSITVNSFSKDSSKNLLIANVTLKNSTGKTQNPYIDSFHLYNSQNQEIHSDVDSSVPDLFKDKLYDIKNDSSITGNIIWEAGSSPDNKYIFKFKPILTQSKTINFDLTLN